MPPSFTFNATFWWLLNKLDGKYSVLHFIVGVCLDINQTLVKDIQNSLIRRVVIRLATQIDERFVSRLINVLRRSS